MILKIFQGCLDIRQQQRSQIATYAVPHQNAPGSE
jgi:hypothetical protein